MEKKMNIAEILKNCPTGMELDCTMFENVTLVRVDTNKRQFPIEIAVSGSLSKYLTKEGCFHDRTQVPESKCVIFPKGKTTWEGFVPPYKFNYGDIVVNASNKDSNAFIYAGENDKYYKCYVGLATGTNPALLTDGSGSWVDKKSGIRPATEEEKEKLFQTIKDNGYKWNAETKALEKLIEPKFKVGDVIQDEEGYKVKITEVNIEDERYGYESLIAKVTANIVFSKQDNYELVPNKFDVSTLIPFESRVLVRDSNNGRWKVSFWGCLIDSEYSYKYDTVRGGYRQCIPYENNEHLLGKIDDCDEYYNTWG